MSTSRNSQTKVQLSCRISPLARTLVSVERKAGGWESDGEAVDALILRASTSLEAYELMQAEANKNPLFAALRNAQAVNSAQSSPDNNARIEKLARVVNPLAGSAAKPAKPPKSKRSAAPSAQL